MCAPVDEDDSVRVVHDALQPVLRQDHRDAEVVHDPVQGGEHLLGRDRVERRGRLVEHEICGPAAKTEAMATRCCCPPESEPEGPSAQRREPKRSRVSSTRRRIVAGSSPIVSMP